MTKVKLRMGERQLDNGFTALAVQNPGVATVSVKVALRVSQVDEVENEYGLSHLVGTSLDEGSAKRGALEIAQAIEGIGGSFSGSVNGGSIHCPAEHVGKALAMLREIVFTPKFPASNFRRVQTEVCSSIQAVMDDASSVARNRFHAEVYGAHPLGRPSYGSIEAVKAYQPVNLRRFHRKWFRPGKGYLVLVGPGTVEASLNLLARRFASLKRGTQDRQIHPDPELPDERREIHMPMKRDQVHVYLGHLGVRRNDDDFYALLVMDHILGTGPGFTSRISRRLRDDMGLCYSVHADITGSAGVHPGTFSAYIGTSAEHKQKAIRGFLEEMVRIRETLPRRQELEDVQQYLTGSFVLGLERNLSLANYAISTRRYGLGPDYLRQYPKLIMGVTREDIRRVARVHLHPDRVVIVSAGA